MNRRLTFVAALLALGLVQAAETQLTGLRGATPLDQEPKAPRLANIENLDVRRGRAHIGQPPTIPHTIDKYEITRQVNFCMYCHARVRTEQLQAPAVTDRHYVDRDHEVRAEVAPRHYFCTQCHVPQTDTRPPIDNQFLDIDKLVRRERTDPLARQTGDSQRRGE